MGQLPYNAKCPAMPNIQGREYISDLYWPAHPDDPQGIRVASVIEFSVCLCVCLFVLGKFSNLFIHTKHRLWSIKHRENEYRHIGQGMGSGRWGGDGGWGWGWVRRVYSVRAHPSSSWRRLIKCANL